MSRLSNRLAAISAVALLAAAPALAQESGVGRPGEPIIIDQFQTGDIWSNMNVVMPDETDYAASTATASGNAAAALVASGDVYGEANQENTGNVGAEARLEGGLAYGQASAVATAYGNSATSTTEGGNSHVRSSQVMRGDTVLQLARYGAYGVDFEDATHDSAAPLLSKLDVSWGLAAEQMHS